MEYLTLGNSGLKVSRACLGAMNFGSGPQSATNEKDAKVIIDAFLDRGHNFIDTANVYTGGQSEEVVGRAIKGRRDQVVLATKGFNPQGEGANDRGLSRLHLTRALDASLKRLNCEYIDLYQCHGADSEVPIEETMETLAGFVRAGKVRYIGCSNFTGSQIVEAQWAASRINGIPFISLQPQYSLIAREIETDILPTCRSQGLGTLIYSPLAGGMLTGKYKQGEEPGDGTRFGRQGMWGQNMLSERNFNIVAAVNDVAKKLNTTETAVSIAWCLSRRNITSVILGPRTLQQLDENLKGFDLALDKNLVKQLSDAARPLGNSPRRR